MSSATIPVFRSASEDWQISDENEAKPNALVVKLRKHVHILPYCRFIHAEGNNAEVKIVFASHQITVKGSGLAQLLSALASQRIIRIGEPTESEVRFSVRGAASDRYEGPSIQTILVEEFK